MKRNITHLNIVKVNNAKVFSEFVWLSIFQKKYKLKNIICNPNSEKYDLEKLKTKLGI